MVTVILGLSALSIVLGYALKCHKKTIDILHEREEFLHDKWKKAQVKREIKYKEDLEKEKENWRQTTNNWILEKEQHIEKLEQEKFNQLHELALMLNDSYHVDEIILSKAEKFDWLVNRATREQKRNFIKGWKVEEV